tara:strand:+ start:8 stop:175 length:168 start_codon:yes stop_codon:yes gene_type:complete
MNKEGVELVGELIEYIKQLEEKNKALVNRIILLEKQLCVRRSSNTTHQSNNIKNR